MEQHPTPGNRAGNAFWGLLAVGAATAVGVTTRDAGFVVITFVGSLVVPRILGLRGHHHHGHCGAHYARHHQRQEQQTAPNA